ncbi:MAG: polyprenyl synthetase family protein [Bacteroidales bacterium]|nr:polyprenyl synthetase family protein [Bacteroidales bacterium]
MIPETTIDQAIRDLFDNLEFQKEPAGLYDPLRYTISIGGKRLRPRLCLTTYGIYANDLTPEILQPAAGLEIFHTFTLIHDDIMDRSPMRRGHETIWKKWNEDTAILSGDVMFIDSYKRMGQAPAALLPQVLDLFSKTASRVCDGQQLDMDFEKRDHVSMAEYMEMIGLKTGVLLACSAQMGALIGGADIWSQECIYDYGYYLGLAFQVADDYLDAYGDEKVFGKPIGGDILNCKKSWLTIRALEKGADGLLDALKRPAETPEEKAAKIRDVMAIYNSVDVAADARKAIADLSTRAVFKGTDAGMGADGLEALTNFAHSLVGRTV